MKLISIVHEDEDVGYWAEVPALPGCASDGLTMDELRANLIVIINEWFEVANSRYELGEGDQVIEIEV